MDWDVALVTAPSTVRRRIRGSVRLSGGNRKQAGEFHEQTFRVVTWFLV
jgi:hypothetical protein